jgi:hypothetical protein
MFTLLFINSKVLTAKSKDGRKFVEISEISFRDADCTSSGVMVTVSLKVAVRTGLFEFAARAPSCSFLPCGGGYFRPAYRVYGQRVMKADSLYCKASGSIERLHKARTEQKALFAASINLGLTEEEARRLSYISAYAKK